MRWKLAIRGAVPATRANSLDVSARPSISAARILAHIGSPASAAVSASADMLNMIVPR
jgi:hypothetical protein